MKISRVIRWAGFALLLLAIPVASFAGVFVQVTIAPPVLPVYVQPACPGDDYIWSVRNQLFGPRADAFGILACETVIKMNVTIFDPAKLLKPLPER